MKLSKVVEHIRNETPQEENVVNMESIGNILFKDEDTEDNTKESEDENNKK